VNPGLLWARTRAEATLGRTGQPGSDFSGADPRAGVAGGGGAINKGLCGGFDEAARVPGRPGRPLRARAKARRSATERCLLGVDPTYVTRPRHIEVQVFADSPRPLSSHSTERELSLQRRHQKVIEERARRRAGPPRNPEAGHQLPAAVEGRKGREMKLGRVAGTGSSFAGNASQGA